MDDELKNFKNKYRAHIQEGNRRYAVPKHMSMGPLSPSHEPFNLNFETERSVQIDMSKRDFEQLIGMEKYWQEQLYWRDFAEYGGFAKNIVEDYEHELRIRNANPAAQKAYEKYQMILAMTKSHYD